MKKMIDLENICNLKRFPLNASKILQSKSSFILDHFFEGEKNELKKIKEKNFLKILKFFDTKKNLNALLAGYVSKTFENFIYMYHYAILDFLNKNEKVIENIIYHSYNNSIVEKIIQNLLFRMKADDLENSQLEIKLETSRIEKITFPLKIKITSKLINQLKNKENNFYPNNIIDMFNKLLIFEYKTDEIREFLQKTMYEKENILVFFNFLIETKDNRNFEKICELLSSLFKQYSDIFTESEKKDVIPFNNSSLFHTFLDFNNFFKEILDEFCEKAILQPNGKKRFILTLRKLSLVKFIHSALKINSQHVNLSLSVSGIFQSIYVF